MKFSIVGIGYVGLSLATLISQKYEVIALDIDNKKVDLINNQISPISDDMIENYLKNRKLKLKATLDKTEAYKNTDYVIIATPTNYDANTNSFDTTTVESVVKDVISINSEATIVIKSTIPLGFTDKIKQKYKLKKIFFSPEFLRESKALYDNLYPSRIIVGDYSNEGNIFAKILAECSLKEIEKIAILNMTSHEAEAVKLFSNTYLAMRISFFNELDTFSEVHNLSTKKVIEGVSHDPRIGHHYNNPSFGYGGYCLPKDTQQLLENYDKVPNSIIKAIVDSNKTRKKFISDNILNKKVDVIGVYRLIMKKGSDNFRESAVMDVINHLLTAQKKVIIYEPFTKDLKIKGASIINDFLKFKTESDLIIANRWDSELDSIKEIIYTRDIFFEN